MSDLLASNLSAGAAGVQPTTTSAAPATLDAVSQPTSALTPTPSTSTPAPSTATLAPSTSTPASVTFTNAQLQALLAQAAEAGARAAAGTPAAAGPAPANPPSKVNLFTKGALVRHSTWDPYDERTRTRHGVVLEVLGAEGETGFARSVVGWFETASGPIGDHELEAD